MKSEELHVITLEEELSWGPCYEYDEDRIKKLIGERPGLTALDVLDLDIPREDKLWTILHEGVLPERVFREMACRFAEEALPIWEEWAKENRKEHLDAPRKAVDVARQFSIGQATREEMAAAYSAARSAAYSAAYSAAHSAAHSAAYSAAYSAARSAAYSAAYSAAHSAAHSAAYSAQINIARDVILTIEGVSHDDTETT